MQDKEIENSFNETEKVNTLVKDWKHIEWIRLSNGLIMTLEQYLLWKKLSNKKWYNIFSLKTITYESNQK